MLKIKKISLFFILLMFFSWNFVNAQEENVATSIKPIETVVNNNTTVEASTPTLNTTSNTATPTEEENLADFVLKRKDKIEKILWIDKKNKEIEEKYSEIIKTLELQKNSEQITNEVITDLKNQFTSINENIENKNKEITELNQKILEWTWNIEVINKQKQELEKEINLLKEDKWNLEKKIKLQEDKYFELQLETKELQIYKDKFEIIVKQKEDETIKEREWNLFIYISIIISYLLIYWIGFKLIKNNHNKSVFWIILTFLLLFSLISYTLIINPWFAIIFIIVWGSLVLAFKDFILSLVGSLIIIKKFKVWDYIEAKWVKGKIISIGAFNTHLQNHSWENLYLWNSVIVSWEPIKNLKWIEEKVTATIKVWIKKENLNMRLQQVIEACKKNEKNFDKNKDIKYLIEEKKNNILLLTLEISWHKVYEDILKIFHKEFKDKEISWVEDLFKE